MVTQKDHTVFKNIITIPSVRKKKKTDGTNMCSTHVSIKKVICHVLINRKLTLLFNPTWNQSGLYH
jgi:hypothetical protein